jgi:hypothetical protein
MRPLAVIVPLVTLVVAACSMLEAIERAPRGPRDCGQVFDQARCLAMADVATAEIGKTRADVAVMTVIPDPTSEGGGMRLGGGTPVHLAVTLNDGSQHDTRMCGLLSFAPACTDDAHLLAYSIRNAYTDVPCGAEPAPNDGCATPLPTVQPKALASASPVAVDAVAIPIDHTGEYEFPLGDGSLPNGILTDASFEFAEAWPDDVALRDGTAWLQIRSLEPDGKPFENYYLHGWRPGVERVRAVLTFDVLWFAPGATLEIRNVVVR